MSVVVKEVAGLQTLNPPSTRIRILDPVGVIEPEVLKPMGRADRALNQRLEGAVLGVLTNVFRGYDVPQAVAERIEQTVALKGIVRIAKPSISRPAGPDTYKKLASQVDAVIVGLCA
jgi:hypothetical protein